jgi:L-lactate dehydrogenase
VDNNADRAEAEADDIRHPFPLLIRLRSAPVTSAIWKVVVSFCFVRASGEKPGETRLTLLKRNTEFFREVVPAVMKNGPRLFRCR